MTTITILAEDIKTSDYMNTTDCAITRALERAGLHGCKDNGRGIESNQGYNIVPHTLPAYKEMLSKVLGMYRTANKVKDTVSDEGLGRIPPIIPIPLHDCSFILPI